MSHRSLAWVVCALLYFGGCAEDDSTLVVGAAFGFIAGAEYSSIRVEIREGSREVGYETIRAFELAVNYPQDFSQGEKVAEATALSNGVYSVCVSLHRDDSSLLVRNCKLVDLGGDLAIVQNLTRDCVASQVTCPLAGASADLVECLKGTCVKECCDPNDTNLVRREDCCPNVAFCNSDDDCPAVAGCSTNRCVQAVCTPVPAQPGEPDACPNGQFCDPDRGCVALPVSGTVDPGTDEQDELCNRVRKNPANLCKAEFLDCSEDPPEWRDIANFFCGESCGSGLRCDGLGNCRDAEAVDCSG